MVTASERKSAPSSSLEKGSCESPKRVKAAGDPRTQEGKRISSKNSIRHGIMSDSPVVFGESEEEWEAHLGGMRESLDPVGHYEEVLVYKAALCWWKRRRIDEWSKGIVNAQLAQAPINWIFQNTPPDRPMLHDDWGVADASAALAALDSVESQSDTFQLSPEGANGIAAAVRHRGTAPWKQEWIGIPDGADPEEYEDWTVDIMRRSLEAIAKDSHLSFEKLVREIRLDLNAIQSLQECKERYWLIQDAKKNYEALMLPGSQADLEMRYAAHLDREFARYLRALEASQRARNDNLPPPIRFEVDQH
jgi:hypothetical protein